MPKKENALIIERGVHLAKEKKGELSKQAAQRMQQVLTKNEHGVTRVFVAGGSRAGREPIYVQEAFLLGKIIAKKKYRLDFGLSSQGIMGAVAKGMQEVLSPKSYRKLPILGITTKRYLSFEKKDAFLDAIGHVIVAKTLEERKNQLLQADFVLFAPGGVGTLDELVYDCVSMQDGALPFKPFILFNVEGFFYHIVEFLKSITWKGFADEVPFIIVEDSFEAGVAFDALPLYYHKEDTKAEGMKAIKQMIYDLPYIIAEKKKAPKVKVKTIVDKIIKARRHAKKEKYKTLLNAIEEVYLNKEIERMYDRMAHSAHDMTMVNDKLHLLKYKRKGL